MRSIQDVGAEILGMHPGKLYIFTGKNYGIKKKYIAKVKEAYGGKYLEVDNIEYLIKLSTTKRILPLQPTVYISRHDSKFVSDLSEKNKTTLDKINLPGTVIIVYDDTKQCDKVEKYLSDNCVRFEDISPNVVKKYLVKDYPNIPESIIDYIIGKSADYARCDTICQQLNELNTSEITGLSDAEISKIFYMSSEYSQDKLKAAVIHRNSDYLFRYFESGNDISDFPYIIFGALVDIEKELSGKLYRNSDNISKSWTFNDVYNLYDITYRLFIKSRSETIDIKNMMCLIVSLLRYNPIPAWEDIQNDAV